jgi:protein-S-isoprenylcysteine O-methyltransferase Ste14
MAPLAAIYGLWAVWVASWFAAASWSAPTVARPAIGREFFYRVFTIAGAVALFSTPQAEMIDVPSSASADFGWAMAALVIAGLLFSWWARIHLGKFWSGTVARKADHRVIDTGPYRLVRHPIYTGIILACYATALAKGTLFAFGGASVMLVGWYTKASLEERFLRTELGAQAYDAYASRVPMLIPFFGR